ncbi:restriction endonuclease subunit S [Lentilactobacillus hilgardii]|uniref:restriction endonuclease subunit S n=1 Tax=Lentilactobacillus hilgardii TaxID=1588 RepID=UPI0021C40A2D|nr:restriction endonuclease subunit S [Lentilactobacillus hilgardii]
MSEEKQPKIRFKGFDDPWEQRKLSELAKIQGGGTPDSTNSKFWNGEINWFTPTEVSNQGYLFESNKKISKSGLKHSSAKLMPVGTVLMTSRAGVGNMGILSLPAATNQGFQSMIPNEDTPSYFLFSMHEIISRKANKLASGSTFTEISGKSTAKITLYIPNKRSEKEKIAELFFDLDNRIAANQSKLEQLKRLKKLLMQKIFNQEWRFKGFTDPWEQRKFSDIAMRRSKQTKTNSLPSIEFENIVSDEGKLKDGFDTKSKHKQGILFEQNDILFGKLRPYLHNWFFATFRGIAVGDFWVLFSQQYDSLFLYYLIQSERFQSIANISTGTKMPRSDWNLVSKAYFYISLDEKEQIYIGKLFKNIDKIIAANQRRLDQLQSLKKYLMQNMFV